MPLTERIPLTPLIPQQQASPYQNTFGEVKPNKEEQPFLFLESIKQKLLKIKEINQSKATGPVHSSVQDQIKQGNKEERVTLLGLTADEMRFLTKTL